MNKRRRKKEVKKYAQGKLKFPRFFPYPIYHSECGQIVLKYARDPRVGCVIACEEVVPYIKGQKKPRVGETPHAACCGNNTGFALSEDQMKLHLKENK